MRTKHPAGVMVLGVVGSDGKKMPPYFFKEGLKINTKVYKWVMVHVVKPWLDETYPDGNYVWQQDSAPAHASAETQDWCRRKLADFWPKELWPPNSPDLNPLDYGIWGYMERKACATSHPNKESLRAAICREWDDMPESYVANTCKSFRGRVEAVIAASGGHIEGKRKKRPKFIIHNEKLL